MSQDQHFKNLILDYPRAALALFAAAEAVDLDPGVRVVPIRQEQLQARLGERFRELDVLLLVEWPDGRPAALLLVLEEESDPRRFSIHRLVHYCLDLAELFGTDRVVPVVIFLRAAVGVAEQLRLGAYRHQYLHFRYLRCALGELAYADYRDSDNLVTRLTMPSTHDPGHAGAERQPTGRRVALTPQAPRSRCVAVSQGDAAPSWSPWRSHGSVDDEAVFARGCATYSGGVVHGAAAGSASVCPYERTCAGPSWATAGG
jgi:hypothetical protein